MKYGIYIGIRKRTIRELSKAIVSVVASTKGYAPEVSVEALRVLRQGVTVKNISISNNNVNGGRSDG